MEEFEFKIILIGDSAVGKTTGASRYTGTECSQNHVPTIGASFFRIDYTYNGKEEHFDLWDTAGQELYRALIPLYGRDAHAAIIFFSVADRDTFEHVGEWNEFVSNESSTSCTMLFGNKTDIPERTVKREEAESYAAEHGMLYYEGSAINDEGIIEMFHAVFNAVIKARDESKILAKPRRTIDVSTTEEKESSSCC